MDPGSFFLAAGLLHQDDMAPNPAHFSGPRGHPARLCARGRDGGSEPIPQTPVNYVPDFGSK